MITVTTSVSFEDMREIMVQAGNILIFKCEMLIAQIERKLHNSNHVILLWESSYWQSRCSTSMIEFSDCKSSTLLNHHPDLFLSWREVHMDLIELWQSLKIATTLLKPSVTLVPLIWWLRNHIPNRMYECRLSIASWPSMKSRWLQHPTRYSRRAKKHTIDHPMIRTWAMAKQSE